jgi:hypothetical protein
MNNLKEERMTDKIISLFSGIEIQKREQINSLMSDWRSEIVSKDRSEYFKKEDPLSYFSSDGFFPGYYNQKIKVLFVGREPRYMDGDYIEWMIKYYRENNDLGKAFTRRLLFIVQGIKSNGELDFEEVKAETAIGIAKEMVSTNDYGFAFINISKYTNDTDGGGRADFYSINKFLEHSNLKNRNFFHEELEILDPDIIITGNLWEGHIEQNYLDLCFDKIEWEKINDDIDGKVNVSNIVLSGKSIKLLNTYAFADFTHSDKEYFYDPIMEIIFGEKDIS